MWLNYLILTIMVLNGLSAIITVFRQPRDIAATWAWLLVLLLLPVLGFVLYWLFGRKLQANKLNALATQQQLGIDQMVASQQETIENGDALLAGGVDSGLAGLMRTLLKADGALITTLNHVEMLTTRVDFTARLFADLEAAQNHIHIEAYTIEPDLVGKKLVKLLTAKAQQGVRVRLIYDTFGSHRLSLRFFKPLIQAGGMVEPFIATRLGRANLRINFRNHRKLTIIDGRIGYMGGFDIGDSPKRLKITRDTQMRVTGQAVAALQARFFMDWNTTAKVKKVHFQKMYFPDSKDTGETTMQLVSGGPEQAVEAIKLGYLRLIATAKKSIWIQTPYFVPDDSLMDALTIAVQSGVDVRMMVPAQTNQPAMAKATRFYLDKLVAAGAKVLLYQDGFMHTKTLVVDGQNLVMGTANLDVRSFKLNFEIAAFIYDQRLAQEAQAQFSKDAAKTVPYTKKMIAAKPAHTRLSEEWSRLLAPIL